jgi:hypothetical protein
MPRVRVKDGDREEVREILGQVLTFGRAPDNHIVLTDRECSRHHCYIEKVEQGCKLVDLESRNGTKANGQFRNQQLLRTNDLITIGKSEILFIDESAPVPSPAARVSGGVPLPAPPARPSGNVPTMVAERTTGPASLPVARKESAPPGAVSRSEPSRPIAATVTSRRQERQDRVLRAHQDRERRTLTTVFVVAGLFISALVGVFIYFISSGSKGEAQYVKGLFDSAEEAVRAAAATEDSDQRAGCYEKAIRQYTLVPSTAEPAYATARQKIEELSVSLKKARQEALGRRIRKEMDEIDQYFKGHQPPDAFGALNRYERLLQTVPADHTLRAEILKRMEQVKAVRDGAAPP